MFRTSHFNGDLSSWDVSNVKEMWCMFRSSQFNNDSLENWNISKDTNTVQMFTDSKLKDKYGNNAEKLRNK